MVHFTQKLDTKKSHKFSVVCSMLCLNQAYSQKVTKFKQRVGKRFSFHLKYQFFVIAASTKNVNHSEVMGVQK